MSKMDVGLCKKFKKVSLAQGQLRQPKERQNVLRPIRANELLCNCTRYFDSRLGLAASPNCQRSFHSPHGATSAYDECSGFINFSGHETQPQALVYSVSHRHNNSNGSILVLAYACCIFSLPSPFSLEPADEGIIIRSGIVFLDSGFKSADEFSVVPNFRLACYGQSFLPVRRGVRFHPTAALRHPWQSGILGNNGNRGPAACWPGNGQCMCAGLCCCGYNDVRQLAIRQQNSLAEIPARGQWNPSCLEKSRFLNRVANACSFFC
jgi:hypothetical protein